MATTPSPEATASNGRERIPMYDAQESYISKNIQLADAKATVTMLAASGAIAFLLKEKQFGAATIDALASIPTLVTHFGGKAIWDEWLALATFLCLALCAALAFWTILPRTRSPDWRLGANAFFWGDAAKFSSSTADGNYVDFVSRLSDDQVSKQKLANLHALSIVCTQKMRVLQFSMSIGAAGFLMLVLWELLTVRS